MSRFSFSGHLANIGECSQMVTHFLLRGIYLGNLSIGKFCIYIFLIQKLTPCNICLLVLILSLLLKGLKYGKIAFIFADLFLSPD